MVKRQLTKAEVKQQERRQAEIRRRERRLLALAGATGATAGWYEALNPDAFRPTKKREPQTEQAENNQVKKQEKQQTPQHDWEGTGADKLIDQWLKKYGGRAAALPRSPAQGNLTALMKAVKGKFAGKRCPKDTTIKDHINKRCGRRKV